MMYTFRQPQYEILYGEHLNIQSCRVQSCTMVNLNLFTLPLCNFVCGTLDHRIPQRTDFVLSVAHCAS